MHAKLQSLLLIPAIFTFGVSALGHAQILEVTNYPWSYVLDLARYVWVGEAAGWEYVQK
jgi:hypothetical protein